FAGSTQPMVADPVEAVLNRTWRPALSVTGADGLTPIASAGNVLRPQTSLKLSLRLPPTTNGGQATHALKRLLEADPPHRATERVCAVGLALARSDRVTRTSAHCLPAIAALSARIAPGYKHVPYRSFPYARRLGSVGILFGLRCPIDDSRDPIRPRCRKSTSS